MANRILFCASEAYPLIKTGGLADVAGSLPRALVNLGEDLRLVLPAYHDVKSKLSKAKALVQTRVNDLPVTILQTTLPGTRVTTWLVDCPPLYERPGNPYHDADGTSWPDNAQRYALFCRVIVMLANDQFGLGWQPQLVHLNDWQTGLVPALLSMQAQRPATVYTIHNLAYQGNFDYETFTTLGLDASLWHHEKLEFYNQLSFMKGGIVYADRVNTVSPSYATEIQTPAFGHGMEGLLQHYQAKLSGIVNGIDDKQWNPGSDPLIKQHYNWQHLNNKQANKLALQAEFKLEQSDDVMLLALISRLVEQKGIDLLLEIMPELNKLPLQLLVLGSGDKKYEQALQVLAQQHPQQLGVHIGYNEALAHQLEAGADAFLMPSRFEPCGLNQMYSQRYGTLPIVSAVGGLRDTVVNTTGATLATASATGFVMPEVSAKGLMTAIETALSYFQNPGEWQDLQKQAMKQDFSWKQSASAYQQLYQQALAAVR